MKDKNEKAEPMEAILVRVVDTQSRIDEKIKKMEAINSISEIELPQGPALINGQWT